MFDDDEIQERLKDRERLLQKQAVDDFLWLMGAPQGRRLVWGWLNQSCVYHTTFDTHGGRMNLMEGKRQQGLKLLSDIHRLCPDLYPVMVKENQPAVEDQAQGD